MFDHTTKLEPGQRLSTRRLQARAAKSAICRAREIYASIEAAEELQHLQDPLEREKRKQQMRQEAEQEIKFLAKRLSDLVPTDMSLDDQETNKIEKRDTIRFEKTAPTEYVAHYDSNAPREESAVIQRLLYEQAKNRVEDESKTAKFAEYSDFIDEWFSRQQRLDDDEGDDCADSGIKTVLV